MNLLDCTLRDGGYINDWKWGYDVARDIIKYLIKADIDVIEVGFLRNVQKYNPDITVSGYIEELNKLLPEYSEGKMFSAMVMTGNYDIEKLSPYSGKGIELIRVTAHEYDIDQGLEFAYQIKLRGYKVSVNPINIMGYTDAEILKIVEQVNAIHPYQFSIVDTFGSMNQKDLNRIVNLIDNNMDTGIRLALHLHENMSLGCLLAQHFVSMHLNRPISVDGSLMGMGRNPGNLPIELIADFLNNNENKKYKINYMLDAIDDYISPIKGKTQWGYTTAYFLSARFNLHRNYAEHYLNKGNLTSRDINQIFSAFNKEKASVFDKEYADRMYQEYMNNYTDDTEDRQNLMAALSGRNILLIAPGTSIVKYKDTIQMYIQANNPLSISINFIPNNYNVDFVFFSNSKRWSKYENIKEKIIATSNLKILNADYYINYNSLKLFLEQDNNALVMLLNLLHELGVESVSIVGADGYAYDQENYYSKSIRSHLDHTESYNCDVASIIKKIGINVTFITPSKYEEYIND